MGSVKIPDKFKGVQIHDEAVEAAKSVLDQAGGDYAVALVLACEQWHLNHTEWQAAKARFDERDPTIEE
jgi:hypothetical protein